MVGSNLGVGKFVIWKVEERERERERERMRSREDGEVGEVGEVKGAGKRGGEDSGFWICSPRQHSLNGFLSKKYLFSQYLIILCLQNPRSKTVFPSASAETSAGRINYHLVEFIFSKFN